MEVSTVSVLGKVEIRVMHATNIVAAIKVFRNATNATIADIRDSFVRQAPIAAAQLYGRDHDGTEARLLALLKELDEHDTEFDLIIDGEVESREYLYNMLQRRRDGLLKTQMMSNLEIGEADIETLEWLQREAPAAVFRITLDQIVSDDRYNIDDETLAWVTRELGNALQSDEP